MEISEKRKTTLKATGAGRGQTKLYVTNRCGSKTKNFTVDVFIKFLIKKDALQMCIYLYFTKHSESFLSMKSVWDKYNGM